MYIFKGLTAPTNLSAPPISAAELHTALMPLSPNPNNNPVVFTPPGAVVPGVPIQPPNTINIFGMFIPTWLVIVGVLGVGFIGYKLFIAKPKTA